MKNKEFSIVYIYYIKIKTDYKNFKKLINKLSLQIEYQTIYLRNES